MPGRYVRIAPSTRRSAPVQAPEEDEIDWGELLGGLAKTGGKFAKLGGGLANLAGYSDVASGLGAVGGPLGLAGGIAEGNPMQAAMGGIQTASTASGLFGGPTISSGLGAGAEALGLGAAGSGLSGLAGPAAIAAAIAVMSIMEQQAADKRRSMGQQIERQTYAQEWPSLTGARERGAGLLGASPDDPASLTRALAQATQGIRATDLASGYDTLSGTSGDTGGQAMDLSEWAKKAPQLEGENWGAWLGLMDQAQAAGLDPERLQARSIPGARERPSVHEGGMALFQPSGSQRYPIKDYGRSSISLLGGVNTGEGYEPGAEGTTTQKAQDISNALAGVGQQLGINWGSIAEHDEEGNWQNQGYTINPEELDRYGFSAGNFGNAALNYLRNLDPTVVERPEWEKYKTSLGASDEALAAMPQGLARLASSPYARRIRSLEQNIGTDG